MSDALILTLRLDAPTFARLDAERRAHFPPGRNFIPAHLTLFHDLRDEAEVAATLSAICARTPPLPLRVTGLRSLGRGVAYELEGQGLTRLRRGLAEGWQERLTPQDRHSWRPHVTVQNKVAPETARTLLAELQARFQPWDARGEGLLLWRYRGGPWEAAGEFPFTGV